MGSDRRVGVSGAPGEMGMASKLPGRAARRVPACRHGIRCLGVRAALWSAVLVLVIHVLGAHSAAASPDVSREIECLALTIYFEARGEPEEGMLAVGHVVMNRASHPRFLQGVCDVVRQVGERRVYRCQFTWWCDRKSDRPADGRAWRRCQDVARRIYWDDPPDPTSGSLWYHADYVQPAWRTGLRPKVKIGRHIFYRAADAFPDHGVVQGVRGDLAGENSQAPGTPTPN